MLKSFDSIKITGDSRPAIAVAGAHDHHTLEAVFSAAEKLSVGYKLVGDREKILSIAAELGSAPVEEDIIHATDNTDCAVKAVGLIRQGAATTLMKGGIETGTLLKAALNKTEGIRGSVKTMSHLAVLEVPAYHKLVGIIDGGMIPYPTLEQKKDIILSSTDFFRRLGVARPKVAVLAASETVSEPLPETGDAAALAQMCRDGELGDCVVEGPLSFDLAVSKEAAEIKRFSSEISGDPDILLLPNISAGNIFAKSLLYWGNAKMAGCVLGAQVPIILVSRGASAEEKFLSIKLSISNS